MLYFISISAFAQNSAGKSDDMARITLAAFVPQQIDKMPEAARSMLANKLSQIVTQSGMGGSAMNQRFILTANIVVMTKDITPTAPPMQAFTLDITLYIGDGIEGTKLASTSVSVKGVGENETKAYVSALKGISPNNTNIQSFVEAGKTKIVEYYNSKCDFIIKDAQTLASQKQYEEAISSLLAVPEVCKECYMACQDLTLNVYKMKLENECVENIQKATVSKANNEWDEAASHLVSILPDVSCYDAAQTLLRDIEDHRCAEAIGKAKGAWANRDSNLASSYLSEVSADSKCANEAKQLFVSISGKLDAVEKRNWDLSYEKYNRNQTQSELNSDQNRDLANRNQTYKESQGFELEKEALKSAREIGVAQAKNQPKVVYNIRGWW